MAEGVSVEFSSPSGTTLRFDWPLDRLQRLDAEDHDTVWERAGELDWDEVESVRVVSGRLDDGRLLALAALRPAGAEGHGDDAVYGVVVDDAGEAESLAQALISTEYGPEGAVRRVGLELYREDDGLALRVAGDATGAEEHRDGGVLHRRITLALRAGGPGVGVLDILAEA
jgi:hypothetical protein